MLLGSITPGFGRSLLAEQLDDCDYQDSDCRDCGYPLSHPNHLPSILLYLKYSTRGGVIQIPALTGGADCAPSWPVIGGLVLDWVEVVRLRAYRMCWSGVIAWPPSGPRLGTMPARRRARPPRAPHIGAGNGGRRLPPPPRWPRLSTGEYDLS